MLMEFVNNKPSLQEMSSPGRKKMVPGRNLHLQKEMESIGNSPLGRYKCHFPFT